MARYEAFPIADIRSGLRLDREPWLAPAASFRLLENAYIDHGRVTVRRGTTELGDLGSGLPVVGIFDFQPRPGIDFLVACDTRRLYQWNPGTEVFDDVTGADEFTGDAGDIFQFIPFEDWLILSNGLDAPKKYDPINAPGVLTDLGTAFDPAQPGVNLIENVQWIMRHRQRLVYLGERSDGLTRFSRARYTNQNAIETFRDALTFADASTNREIRSATLIDDNIVVFFTGGETWRYRYTADPRAPYDWEKRSSKRGIDAPFSIVPIENGAMLLSLDGVMATDGIDIREVDEDIEKWTLNLNPERIDRSIGHFNRELEHVWWAVPGPGAESNDQILSYNFHEPSYATLSLALTYLADWRQVNALTIDDIEETWDEIERTWDEFPSDVGFPVVLAGTSDGKVILTEAGTMDYDGSDIEFRARLQRLNPYKVDRARLGWVDVICDQRVGATMTIKLYKDYDSASYYQQDISLEADDPTASKVRRRVAVNQIADGHSIELSAKNLSGLGVDAVIPYFAPVSGGREV